MVLSKAEALAKTSKEDQDSIALAVERLDKILAAYHGEPVHVDAATCGRYKARDRVLQMYREAGWAIEFIADQRDGDCYRFS